MAKFGMGKAKSASTPLMPGSKLYLKEGATTPSEKERMESIPYRQAVGTLMYLSTCTRPHIAVAISTLNRFCQNPGMAHWEGVKRV